MKHFPESTQALLAVLLVAGMSGALAVAAQAGGGHGRGECGVMVEPTSQTRVIAVRGVPHPRAVRYARIHPQFGRVDFGLYRRGRVWVARPIATSCFVVRRGRVTVVRPVPVWVWASPRQGVSVNVRFRSENACAVAAWTSADPEYGCALCGESFSSYRGWERHTRGCARDEFHGHVAFESWDPVDLDYFRFRLDVSGLQG